ncbi:MAG: DoxX family protein [Acidobacteriaceae bacterium]|nr:DoxX family protein [Acidobacteriaceae bacterium]
MRLTDVTYALMRSVVAALYVCHGVQKIFGLLGAHAVASSPLFMAAGWIELIAGTLILVGLFTRAAAFLASGQMAYAYFTVHAPGAFWPIVNQGELAVAYCFVFLYVCTCGAGVISLDSLRGRRGSRRA